MMAVAEVEKWEVTCRHCDGPAFIVIGPRPIGAEPVTAERVEHVDGRPFNMSEVALCDTCGQSYAEIGVKPSTEWRRRTAACPPVLDPEPVEAMTWDQAIGSAFGSKAERADVEAVSAVLGMVNLAEQTEAA